MKTSVKRILYWTPRILGLLFALFISLFALDVLDGHHGLWNTILALLMHLIPTWIVLAVLAVAWRWEWVGGVLFLGLGGWYALHHVNHLSWIVTISGPAFLVGALFLLNWIYRRELRADAA